MTRATMVSSPATRQDEDGNYYDEHGNPMPDPDWISEETYLGHQALEEGDRGAALEMWRRVAEGKRSTELDYFVREVARRLIEADRYKQDARRAEIIQAVGLMGDLSPTLARDRRIAELLGRPAREIWRVLAEDGLYKPAPDGQSSEPIPHAIEMAIRRVRAAMRKRHQEMIRGFEDLSKS